MFIKRLYLHSMFSTNLEILRHFSGELDRRRRHVLSNTAHVVVGSSPSGIDLLRVGSVLRVKELHLSVREDTEDVSVNLELGAQLGQERQALLLPRQLEQVRALPHDRGSSGRHLEDLLLLGLPGDNVELLNLRLAQQATCTDKQCVRGQE